MTPALLRRDVAAGLSVWGITGLLVAGAGIFGNQAVVPAGEPIGNVLVSFCLWDGGWYTNIVRNGYSYNPAEASTVVFFPAYPLFARMVQSLVSCSAECALLVTSHLFLALSLIALHAYIRRRYPTALPHAGTFGITVFALFPSTFFFRMAYSESLFFFTVMLVLLAVERGRSLLWIALIVGLATAARPVGIGLLPIVIREIVRRAHTRRHAFAWSMALVPLSCWGLIAYAGFLQWQFDEPLAFIKAQRFWNIDPNLPFVAKLGHLASLKPLWGAFLADSGCCLDGGLHLGSFTVSPSALNAAAYLAGIVLVIAGGVRGWLNTTEMLASIGLLAIPYITRGYDSFMLSFARFTAVVPPVFLALTMLLLRLPYLFRVAYLLFGTALLCLLSALFAAGYHLV